MELMRTSGRKQRKQCQHHPLFPQTRESARRAAPPTSWWETIQWRKRRWRPPSVWGPSEPRRRRRCARTTASFPPTPSSKEAAARGPFTSSSSLKRTVRTEKRTRMVCLRSCTVALTRDSPHRTTDNWEPLGSDSASLVQMWNDFIAAEETKGRLGKFDSTFRQENFKYQSISQWDFTCTAQVRQWTSFTFSIGATPSTLRPLIQKRKNLKKKNLNKEKEETSEISTEKGSCSLGWVVIQ